MLSRRYTRVRLAQLSEPFGLPHPDSPTNLVRPTKTRAEQSAASRRQIALAEAQLAMKTKDQL
ncbi:MAG: hypothetical protein D6743_20185 [Calditrichaeota bacterium]|nr:MAG: hypothetical protein D6743_20185 [Calditrichota bacterium]